MTSNLLPPETLLTVIGRMLVERRREDVLLPCRPEILDGFYQPRANQIRRLVVVAIDQPVEAARGAYRLARHGRADEGGRDFVLALIARLGVVEARHPLT